MVEKSLSGRRKKSKTFLRKILALPEGFSFNFFTQKFEPKLEAEFREKYFRENIMHIRVALLLAIIIYAAFSLLDYILAPELFNDFFIIRFVFIIPIVLSVFLFSYYHAFKKYHQLLMLTVFMATGAGLIIMVYLAVISNHPLVSSLYSFSLVLVFFFGYIILKLRYTLASISGWSLLLIISMIMLIIPDISKIHVIATISFILTSNIFGTIASYLYELSDRKNFYSQRQLDNERKKIKRMNLELEKRVLERTRDFQEAKNKAEESDQLITAFLANMSHEIRTPMNGILGFTEILMDSSVDGKKKDKYIGIIHDRARYLLELLNNIIDISLIESNQLRFNYEQIDLNSFMEKIYEFNYPLFSGREIEFTLNLEKSNEHVIIESDSEKLEQILVHFINNASKFTREGKIILGYRIMEDKLRLYVEDTGPGVPESIKDYIFHSFTKYEEEQQAFKTGTGLGLSISRGLARFLDGEIGFISKEKEGSTFYVDFLLIEIMQM
ncbi:MAG: sensor histidine kinase [Bacteroidota bacterium]